MTLEGKINQLEARIDRIESKNLDGRVSMVQEDIERLERNVSLKIPKEFHECLYKHGYYHVVSLNGSNPTENPQIQIQVLNDRIRLSFEIQGRYRVIQYDMFFE